MAKAKIEWCEKKGADWIQATVTLEDGTKLENVSINRTSKSGEAFPNFDGIMTGHTIEGEPWTSQAGKNYLFPPKKKLEAPAFIKAQRGANVEKAMARKEESIGKFQDSKEWSIKLASSMGKAVDLAIAEKNYSAETFEVLIKKWRKFIMDNWDMEEPNIPF